MAEATAEQSRLTRGALLVAGLFSILLATNGIGALFGPPETNTRNPAITETALGAFCGWVLGSLLVFMRRRGEAVSGFAPETLRVLYTWGCAMCLLHIAVAFHLAHGWSHEAAWEHTRQTGGFGDGIFVNYLFALVWFVDVVWAWVAFDSYLNRSRWIGRSVYGFTGFVVFNAGVVFNTGFERAVCALLFSAPLVQVWKAWRKGRNEGTHNSERAEK